MQETKVATSIRILSAAAELFGQKPYGDTSVDQIAESAGLTKMTVYQHFKSKDRLFIACLRLRLERREEKLDRFFKSLSPDADPLVAIFDWLEDWLDPHNFRGCAFVKAVSELSAILPEVHDVATEAKQRVRQRITTLAKASGRPDATEVGQELALLFEGAQSLAFIEGSARPAQTARRIARKLLAA
jgi:AcrR family transcriptional regulator